MPAWSHFEASEPAMAERVRAIFAARRHHTLATIRRDGSPRVSGIEIEFAGGMIVLGMMPGSRKLGDILRDQRVALHGQSPDPPQGGHGAWAGDAKITGALRRLGGGEDLEPPGPRFSLDISEVVLTSLSEGGESLRIESWSPSAGHQIRMRR